MPEVFARSRWTVEEPHAPGMSSCFSVDLNDPPSCSCFSGACWRIIIFIYLFVAERKVWTCALRPGPRLWWRTSRGRTSTRLVCSSTSSSGSTAERRGTTPRWTSSEDTDGPSTTVSQEGQDPMTGGPITGSHYRGGHHRGAHHRGNPHEWVRTAKTHCHLLIEHTGFHFIMQFNLIYPR